tara:strand:- start:349 stop:663 length:315 start_codon:yes stop_codon:yes gene_type:complete
MSSKDLQFSKVLNGRDHWHERSNKYQGQKRKLEEKNRYLQTKVAGKEGKITQLQQKLEEETRKRKELASKNQVLREELLKKKDLEKEVKHFQGEVESLKKKLYL